MDTSTLISTRKTSTSGTGVLGKLKLWVGVGCLGFFIGLAGAATPIPALGPNAVVRGSNFIAGGQYFGDGWGMTNVADKTPVYLRSTFAYDAVNPQYATNTLLLQYSFDGYVWRNIRQDGLPVWTNNLCGSTYAAIRDPTIMWHHPHQCFYVAWTHYTNWTSFNTFGIARSTNLIEWYPHAEIKVTDMVNPLVWLGDWYQEGGTNFLQVGISKSDLSVGVTNYVTWATDNTLLNWATPVMMQPINDNVTNCYDTFLVRDENGLYHNWGRFRKTGSAANWCHYTNSVFLTTNGWGLSDEGWLWAQALEGFSINKIKDKWIWYYQTENRYFQWGYNQTTNLLLGHTKWEAGPNALMVLETPVETSGHGTVMTCTDIAAERVLRAANTPFSGPMAYRGGVRLVPSLQIETNTLQWSNVLAWPLLFAGQRDPTEDDDGDFSAPNGSVYHQTTGSRYVRRGNDWHTVLDWEHIGGVGTYSTNVASVGRFANWLHTPNVPLRFVCFGDSIADDIYTWFEIPLRSAFGVGGGYSLAAQTSDFQCSPWTNGAASLTEQQRNADWFLNHYEMTDDAGEIVYRAHSGLGLGRTNIWADTFSISYAQQVGGGAIEVLLSKDNGAYQSVKYIPTAGSGGGFVTNFTASDVALTPGYYCMKLKGDAIDPVTIIGAGLWHSSSNRVWTSLIQEGGLAMANILAVPTNTLFRVLSNINPHVAFFCMDAENPQAGFETNLWRLEWIFTNVWTNCDVIYIGNPPSSRVDGADVLAHNRALKQHAANYGRFYFDWHTPMRSWDYANSMGWMDDTIHPSRKGATFGGGLLWRELGYGDNIFLSSVFSTNQWPDGSLHLLNTASTNNLGIGTTSPKERVTVHGGAYDGYTHIGSVAAGYGSLWFGNAARACTWAELGVGGDASGVTFINAPVSQVRFMVAGGVKAFWSSVGSLALDSTVGTEPAAGDIRLPGKIQFTTTGPTISFGSGAPSASEPNGSIYLRTDGTGPNLYVRENSAWVAK